jgi:hypothetical protein
MRRRGLCVALAVTALSAVGASAASVPAPNEGVYAPKDCTTPLVEPHRMVLACGDRSLLVAVKSWDFWHKTRAHGYGTLHSNECVPHSSCLGSEFARYKVKFHLEKVRVRRCFHTAPRPLFRRIVLGFTEDKPSYAHRVHKSRLLCN